MQLRVNDVEVNKRPKFLTRYTTDSSHVIIIPSRRLRREAHYPTVIERSDKLLPHQEANQGGIRKGKHPV